MASMDLMALLSTIVLVATISTTIFAVAAYVVSRGYVKKKGKTKGSLGGGAPAAAVPAKTAAAPAEPVLRRYNPYNAA
jgi:hypothetical protein